MEKNEENLYVARVARFIDRVAGRILFDSIPLEAEFAWSKDPVAFDDRLGGTFKPAVEGDVWGHTWESAWFHLTGKVPAEWKSKKVVAQLDFAGEGLVFTPDGEVVQGISNGSVFQVDFARDVVHLYESAAGDETVDLWVETAANGLFGMFADLDPSEDAPHRYGHYEAKVNRIRLCLFDAELWKLWLDLRILNGLIKTLPEKSVRRARVIHTVNEALDAYADERDNLSTCQEILGRELSRPAADSDLSVTAVGHAHIDTAWLWPVCETVRKCARTFSSQLALIDRYPEYVFGASQPQHYAFVKEHYPALYERIKKAVAEKRWEPQGGMWVEADCNIISGESMVRQLLHGKNFFKDEFGVDVDNLWLPDVFGYSAALPQILRKSGIRYFLTQKLSWSQFNEFPHHTFNWRGIDGSEVLTHFPPENNYNSQLGTDFLVPAQEHFRERGFIDEFISLFGVGDGGGGPEEENIELGRRMADLEGSPRVRFGSASDFFDRLGKHEDKLATWVGELYLELHRGTLTTQGLVKKGNRQLEQLLPAVEMLWSMLPLDQYPSEELDASWKKLLLNQFHDILPGSSINRVYRVTHEEHRQAVETGSALARKAAEMIAKPSPDSLLLANCLDMDWEGYIGLPESWKGCSVTDDRGGMPAVQQEGEQLIARVSMEPCSFLTLNKGKGEVSEVTSPDELVLENDLVRYEFDQNGNLTDGWDKEADRQIVSPGVIGNLLTLYDDHPNDWDAWDVDLFYTRCKVATAAALEEPSTVCGPVRQGIRFTLGVGGSVIEQCVSLVDGGKRLDFDTTVNWREKHRMLRVSFPVDIHTDQASFDIQYGYVRRPTHSNTMWDKARFEVAAHRYADLSDNDYGVALLNDCKYGYRVHDNVLDLNLLRSPNYPDPDADQGEHRFTYSLLPHRGRLDESDVISQAAMLNRKPLLFDGLAAKGKVFPWKLSGQGLSLEVVKKAEKDDCLILRIVETLGRHSTGVLTVDREQARLVETNLIEWENSGEIPCDSPIELSLKPFEIMTFLLKEH